MPAVIAFLKAALPALKALAAMTPNTIDDKVVAILEALLANQGTDVPSIHEHLKAVGSVP